MKFGVLSPFFFLDKKETKNQEENMLPRCLCVLIASLFKRYAPRTKPRAMAHCAKPQIHALAGPHFLLTPP